VFRREGLRPKPRTNTRAPGPEASFCSRELPSISRLTFFRLTRRRRDRPTHAFIDDTLALCAKFPLAALHRILPFAGGQKDKWQHKKQHSHLATKRPKGRNLSS